jgi:hypothetical protein
MRFLPAFVMMPLTASAASRDPEPGLQTQLALYEITRGSEGQ